MIELIPYRADATFDVTDLVTTGRDLIDDSTEALLVVILDGDSNPTHYFAPSQARKVAYRILALAEGMPARQVRRRRGVDDELRDLDL